MSRHDYRADDDRGGAPEPGFYTVRQCRGGPWVPARIMHDPANGLWSATIDGAAAGRPAEDPLTHEDLMRIWHWGKRSNANEHGYLASLKAWAEQNQPEHPLLHPRRRIDIAGLPPVIPGAVR